MEEFTWLVEAEAKEDYEREQVIYRLFGGEKKLADLLKKAEGPLRKQLALLVKEG
ncbi:DUF6138 family protein [Paenibacillus donghaensis]|uniref:DUF6138 family protein n=1 Tax=Paenibacillus donghaensis TaxID=414771 RepID=UPI0012F9FE70|nr:DUF6138 family protein [Paenibacillus donghaensis]